MGADAQIAMIKEQFSQTMQQFLAQLEAQRVAIEQFKAETVAQSTAQEAVRLTALDNANIDLQTFNAQINEK
jgi:hypothetical protein